MTDDERIQCNCLSEELGRIVNKYNNINFFGDPIERSIEYIDNNLKQYVNSYNSKRSKKYRFWIDGYETIDIDEYIDASEYPEPYQSIINSLLDNGYDLPENFKLVIFHACVFVKGVPTMILDSTKIG